MVAPGSGVKVTAVALATAVPPVAAPSVEMAIPSPSGSVSLVSTLMTTAVFSKAAAASSFAIGALLTAASTVIGAEMTLSNASSSSWKIPTTLTRNPASAAVSSRLSPVTANGSPPPRRRSMSSKMLVPGSSSDCQVHTTGLATSPNELTLSASVTPVVVAVSISPTAVVPKTVG